MSSTMLFVLSVALFHLGSVNAQYNNGYYYYNDNRFNRGGIAGLVIRECICKLFTPRRN